MSSGKTTTYFFTLLWPDPTVPDAVAEAAEALAKARAEQPHHHSLRVLEDNSVEVRRRWAAGEYDDMPVTRFGAPQPLQRKGEDHGR